MNWHEFITGLYNAKLEPPGVMSKAEFYPAASAQEIAGAEGRLDAKLPPSLRSLLLGTNGVMDMMAIDGGEWFNDMWLLWTVSEIVERNFWYRAASENGTYERDFRGLVFFAGAGADGILFAFPVLEDQVCAPRVVVWHPIEDELNDVAPSLEDFLRGWLTGSIPV